MITVLDSSSNDYNLTTSFTKVKALVEIMQSHGEGDVTEWHSHFPEGVPQQDDAYNCGIFVIANALATVLGEKNSGQIDPDQWRYWLAGEAIAKGASDGTHLHKDIIPKEQRWPMCLWQETMLG